MKRFYSYIMRETVIFVLLCLSVVVLSSSLVFNINKLSAETKFVSQLEELQRKERVLNEKELHYKILHRHYQEKEVLLGKVMTSIKNVNGIEIKVINSKYETFLFDKFEVPEHLQLYVSKLARYYDISLATFISLVQIESWWGRQGDYKSYKKYRMYGKNKEWADIGLGQLSSRYFSFFEKEHMDLPLMRKFGFVRSEFDAEDDIVNLQVAASYFLWLINHFGGNIEKAIMGYNAGPYVKVIPDRTYIYTKAILANNSTLNGET